MLCKPSARPPFLGRGSGSQEGGRRFLVGGGSSPPPLQYSGLGSRAQGYLSSTLVAAGPQCEAVCTWEGGLRTVVSGRSTLPEAASVPAGPTDGPWIEEEPVCRQVSTTQGLLASGGGPGSVLPVPSPVPKFCQGTSGSSIFLCVCDASWRREVVSPVPGALPPTPMAGPVARGSSPSYSPPLPSR